MIRTENGFLGDRYQVLDPIGRGGMATVYRGHDRLMDRAVAIKVLRKFYATVPQFLSYFQWEAKIAMSLEHPNIVKVFDYGQSSDGRYFLVMELIEGTDLRHYQRSRSVLSIEQAAMIAHDVALGLGAAHRRNIVHRGVKPQDILIGHDSMITVIDFSFACDLSQERHVELLTLTGLPLGTVQYKAPEQVRDEIVSPATDVYALGIVMYEMLTGRTPFDGDTPTEVARQHVQDAPIPPSQFNAHIPPAIENIILRCMEKEPERRYHDGSNLARVLEEIML